MAKTQALAKRAAPRIFPEESHLAMHGAHRQWSNDNALWRDEIALWQTEIKRLVEQLTAVKQALKRHQDEVRKHAAAVHLYQSSQDDHERALADYEAGGPGAPLVGLAKQHRQEQDKHQSQRALHERLKRRHHTLVAHWNLLLKSLTPVEQQ